MRGPPSSAIIDHGQLQVDLEDLLGGLFYIALADGRLCPAEDAYLRQVARLFGFAASDYARMRAAFAGAAPDSHDDPHAVLGVPPDASLGEIRAAYRRLVRAHHPDLLAARGMSRERVAQATARVARINAARDTNLGGSRSSSPTGGTAIISRASEPPARTLP